MAEMNKKNTGHDDDAVAKLLGGLRRVETPNDFGVRVKARIAERRSHRNSSFWLPVLKLVTPVAAVTVLGAFLYLGGIFNGDVTDLSGVPPVAEDKRIQSPPDTGREGVSSDIEFAAVNADAPDTSVIAQSNARTNTNGLQKTQTAVSPVRERTPAGPGAGSSVSRAATVPEAPIRPPGLSPNPVQTDAARPEGFKGGRSLTAVDLVSLFGAAADMTGDGMVVRSVASSGIAERSGIKPGDVITAIDGDPVNGASRFEGGKAYRTISIRRDGQRIDLEIRNR